MVSIQEQIQEAKQNQENYLKEFYYMDYCNNCRTGLAAEHDIPCHHTWYCWHTDEDGIGDLQRQIIELECKEKLTSKEYFTLKKLKDKRFKISKKRLREWRQTQRKNS